MVQPSGCPGPPPLLSGNLQSLLPFVPSLRFQFQWRLIVAWPCLTYFMSMEKTVRKNRWKNIWQMRMVKVRIHRRVRNSVMCISCLFKDFTFVNHQQKMLQHQLPIVPRQSLDRYIPVHDKRRYSLNPDRTKLFKVESKLTQKYVLPRNTGSAFNRFVNCKIK